MSPALRRLAVATVIATGLLVVLGGTVRATNAGLACPDWPLCHGRVLPLLHPLVVIEWTHRFVASLVGVLTIALAVSAWRTGRPALRRAVTLAGGLLALQVFLGGLTVWLTLTPAVVAAHLGTAMAFLGAMVVLTGAIYGVEGSPGARAHVHRWALASAASTYLLILLGGYVAASQTGLACPDLPLCGGRVVVPFAGPAGVHFAHRLLAVVVAILVIVTAVRARRSGDAAVARTATAATVLVVVQIVLGAANVLTRLADPVTVAHLGTAAALFATLVLLSAQTGALAGDIAPEFVSAAAAPVGR